MQPSHPHCPEHISTASRLPFIVCIAATFAGSPHVAHAQDSDAAQGALIHFEWAGVSATRDAHAATPFGRLLARPSVGNLTAEIKRAIHLALRKQAADEGQIEVADAVINVLTTLWERPWTIDLLDVSMSARGPSFRAIWAIDAGAERAQGFTTSLETCLIKALQTPAGETKQVDGRDFKSVNLPNLRSMSYGAIGDFAYVAVGGAAPSDCATATDPSLASALQKIGTKNRKTLAMLHVNAHAILHQARDTWSAMSGGEQTAFPPPIEAALDATGLDRLQSITGAWQIDGNAYRESWFVALPAKEGRPKWMHQTPVTDDDLALVPADVTFAKVVNIRLADIYDGLMYVAESIGPMAKSPVEAFVAQTEATMGLRIRQDILESLDDGWVAYISPASGGIWFTGITVMVEARDAAAVVDMLDRLAAFAGHEIEDGAVSIGRSEYKGRSIHTMAFSKSPVPIAPAWCATDRHVILALYPQVVMGAIDHVATSDTSRSILSNADFSRARTHIPAQSTAIVYSDARTGVDNIYRLILPLATAGISMLRSEGMHVTPDMIPMHAEFLDGVFGDIMSTSTDNDGFLFTAHGSWPVAGIYFTAPVIAGLSSSVLLPGLARARENAKRIASLSNARSIVMACHIYATENNAYPPDLDTLIENGHITENQLRSPRSETDQVSYVYIAGVDFPPAQAHWTILIYEKQGIRDGEGSAVGFADGHAEWLEADDLENRLREQQ